jgi:hypothetical protein
MLLGMANDPRFYANPDPEIEYITMVCLWLGSDYIK